MWSLCYDQAMLRLRVEGAIYHGQPMYSKWTVVNSKWERSLDITAGKAFANEHSQSDILCSFMLGKRSEVAIRGLVLQVYYITAPVVVLFVGVCERATSSSRCQARITICRYPFGQPRDGSVIVLLTRSHHHHHHHHVHRSCRLSHPPPPPPLQDSLLSYAHWGAEKYSKTGRN